MQQTDKFQKLVRERKWKQLKYMLEEIPAPEIPDILFLAEKHDRVLMFRTLSRRRSAYVFSNLEPEQQDELLYDLTDAETQSLLATLNPDDRTALLEELPGQVSRRLLGLLDSQDLMESRELMGYPEESVGRLMTPDYASALPHWTVEKTLDHIRKVGKDSETINIIYVVDESGKLLDDVRLRKLILASPQKQIGELCDSSYGSLSAFDDREKAVRLMQQYDLMALPVLNSDDELIGIVTFDDIMDVAEEEATEDMHIAASMSPLKMSYHRATVLDLVSKRAAWLVILVLMNLASASVLTIFGKTLAEKVVLISFIPLLLGTGGNTGAQASTLVIRALVIGDIKLEQWFLIVGRELIVGAILGTILGFVGSILGYFLGGNLFNISLVVGSTLFLIVLYANLIGMSLPFILAKLNIDPAVASGPLISTIVDASGLLIYVFMAMLILGI